MTEKKVSFGIDDGQSFFAHEISLNFNPTQFILDFKCITPRIDPRSREGIFLNLKHNVVMIDPYHAKKLQALLGNVIKNYEEQFGEIKKPKQIEAHEKKVKKKISENKDKETIGKPTYFG